MQNELTLKERIITKAWEDQTFKSQLVDNPRSAILHHFDVELPDDIELEALTETNKKVYLVIPPTPTARSANEPKEGPMWA